MILFLLRLLTGRKKKEIISTQNDDNVIDGWQAESRQDLAIVLHLVTGNNLLQGVYRR